MRSVRVLRNLGRMILGRPARDETGSISTETAVVAGLLIAVAVAGGAIMIQKVEANAEAIPDNGYVQGGGNGGG